jgi:two-component sensor histidine kinase
MPSSTLSARIKDAPTFAQAIVDTLREPVLILDKDFRVVVASRSYCRAYEKNEQDAQGMLWRELGGGQWDAPGLRLLLEWVATENGVVEAFEIERDIPDVGRRTLLLNARKLHQGDPGAVMLAIEDITERRAAERERDDLIRQKQVLLDEMQHRISNSLQLIASILLMQAKSVGEGETRAHLHDAHRRVLAVAAVQRHLRTSEPTERIALQPYFQRLCDNLAGAIIPAGVNAVRLDVDVANAAATSAVSVNLGLIVTELVINALKYAFPIEGPNRVIRGTYLAEEGGWTLTVADNGSGMAPDESAPLRSGLGSSIVRALAEQLAARMSVASGPTGTTISVRHEDAWAV